MYTCQMFCYIVDKNSETRLEVLKKFYNRENHAITSKNGCHCLPLKLWLQFENDQTPV